MNYTLTKGVDDRPERIRSYLLRGLPIVVASMIAVVGAFTQANNNSSESNNQEPLAIYTEAASDFGNPSNPQGNGGNNQSTPTTDPSTTSAPQEQPRLSTAQSGSTSSPLPTTATPALPVGGSGGDGGGCICQQLQETINTQTAPVTGALPPITPPTLP